MTNDILNGIGDLIQRLHDHADNLYDTGCGGSVIHSLALEAATTIDILAERVIDSENNSALRAHSLEQQLLTKQAYIEYLEKRLDDSSVGFVKMPKEYLEQHKDNLPLSVPLSLAEGMRKSKQEFKEKYGELLDVYGEESQDIILEIHQHVITENASIVSETDGQFTGGVYDIVYQLKEVELDLGKTETRTYFFTMEWNTSMKEHSFYSLEVYAKPN